MGVSPSFSTTLTVSVSVFGRGSGGGDGHLESGKFITSTIDRTGRAFPRLTRWHLLLRKFYSARLGRRQWTTVSYLQLVWRESVSTSGQFRFGIRNRRILFKNRLRSLDQLHTVFGLKRTRQEKCFSKWRKNLNRFRFFVFRIVR